MKRHEYFGSYNVPPISEEAQSASFTTPGNISKDMLDQIVFYESPEEDEEIKATTDISEFDNIILGVLSVPKPKTKR